ncbi:Indole-3-pyruvate decarboxylase [Candidatus Electrothrix laxa]
MNIAESTLHFLKEQGVGEIFGIPGDYILPFFKVVEESGILPLYTLSHEPAIGFAADATARIKGRPSVAAVTYGAGALNMVNPVAQAYAEKSPVVVISGGPGIEESHTGLLLHHQAKTLDSQMQIYKEITCDQVRLDDLSVIPKKVARAMRSCLTHSRPVYIEIPRDIIFEPCNKIIPEPPEVCDPDALDACADEIISAIDNSENPVMMVGVEIRRFNIEHKIGILEKKLGIPVVTNFMGHGLLANDDVLKGTYLGVAGRPELATMVEESDALFLLGVILCDGNFGMSGKKINFKRCIRAIEGQVHIGFHTYPRLPITDLVNKLLEKLEGRKENHGNQTRKTMSKLEPDDNHISPTDIAKGINDLISNYGPIPVASDVGDAMFTSLDISGTPIVSPGYYASMGFGVPAGMALCAAQNKRSIVVVGDGGFQMTGFELGNCRKYGWNPIVIILNNQSWEMLRTFQPESKFNELDDWHFAQMAPSLGGAGYRVNTRREFKEALDKAITKIDTFQLIEVMIPRGVLSQTMSQFVAARKG